MTPETTEEIVVDQNRVSCDGGDGSLGHPRVWLQIARESGHVVCPYCDRTYVLRTASKQK